MSYGSHHDAYHSDPENVVEYTPLTEVPLKIKIAAVKMFPDLLEAILKSQASLIEDINKAAAEYDAFAKTLNIPKEGR